MDLYEYVVIVKLTDETAKDLNQYTGTDGLNIDGNDVKNSRELNACNGLHGRIKSRVFIVTAKPGSDAIARFGAKKAKFTFPDNKEFVTTEI